MSGAGEVAATTCTKCGRDVFRTALFRATYGGVLVWLCRACGGRPKSAVVDTIVRAIEDREPGEPRNYHGYMHYKKAPESVTACGLVVGRDVRSIGTSFRTEWTNCLECKAALAKEAD